MDAHDPFQENAKQHESLKQASKAAIQRLMLVALDEEFPLASLTRAANIAAPILRSFLRSRRSGARLFFLTAFLMRRAVKAHRCIRAAILKYAHLRRRRIDRCVAEWTRLETEHVKHLQFVEFAVAFVPHEKKRQIVVAFHCAACHEFIRATHQYAPQRRARFTDYYDRAFALRTVSSRSARIVRLFVGNLIDLNKVTHRFLNGTVSDLLTVAARISIAPRITGALKTLDDHKLVTVARALQSQGATRDALFAQLNDLDDTVLALWCKERLQHANDLPPQPFENSARLRQYGSIRVVNPELQRQDEDAVAALAQLFKAAWRAKATLKTKTISMKRNRRKSIKPSMDSSNDADPTQKLLMELRKEMTNRAEQRAETDRMMQLAAELAAAEAFQRPLSLVGDSWVDEPVWSCTASLTVNTSRSLSQIRSDARSRSAVSNRALSDMIYQRIRAAAAEQRAASRVLPASSPRIPQPPSSKRSSPKKKHLSSIAVRPPSPVFASEPWMRPTTTPRPVQPHIMEPADRVGPTPRHIHLVPRGTVGSSHQFPKLQPFLEAPLSPQGTKKQWLAPTRTRHMRHIAPQALAKTFTAVTEMFVESRTS